MLLVPQNLLNIPGFPLEETAPFKQEVAVEMAAWFRGDELCGPLEQPFSYIGDRIHKLQADCEPWVWHLFREIASETDNLLWFEDHYRELVRIKEDDDEEQPDEAPGQTPTPQPGQYPSIGEIQLSPELELALDSIAPRIHIGAGRSPTAQDTLRRLRIKYTKLDKITEIIGRVSAQGRPSKMVKVPGGRGEVKGYELGADLSKLATSELLRLAHPKLKLLMLKAMVEGQLVIEEHNSLQPAGLGPAIIAVDCSGSMCDPMDTELTRSDVAAGILIGLTRAIHRQKRNVYVIPFGTTVYPTVVAKWFMPQDIVTEKLMEAASRLLGGTEFNPPMQVAIGLLRLEPTADIVFITDGEGDNLRALPPKEARLTVVQIGGSGGGSLAPHAHHVVPVVKAQDGYRLGDLVTRQR